MTASLKTSWSWWFHPLGTKTTNTGPFLWIGSSKIKNFTDIWQSLCQLKDASYCVALAAYLVMTLRFDKILLSYFMDFLNVGTNRKYFNAEHVDPSSNAKWKLEISHDIKIQILSQHNRHNYSLMKKKWLFWTVANSFIYCLSDIHFFFLTITDFLGRVKTRQIHIF